MYWTSTLVAAITAGFPSWAAGQESGWLPNQVNATMCAWRELRAAQVRDTVYMDGGFLYWIAGLADGELEGPIQDGNPLGIIHTLNFSRSFDSNTNISDILGTIYKGGEGQAINNIAPNYLDGGMLANNNEFFLYGGLVMLSDSPTKAPPAANDVLAYQAYSYEVPGQTFRGPSFYDDQLPPNITRYVTYGGAANAPSENKAWYFGGSRAPTWGPVYQVTNKSSLNPIAVSNHLITLDIGESEKMWNNATLPDYIPSRASPSVVWVPVGEQGILVVLGGVSYPAYSAPGDVSLNAAQSEKDSPGYISNIDIYDVAGDKWYQQPTTGAPNQTALGCAVAAPAQDMSSYNIYYYGGFDGIHENENYYDDVWVLSLPSFTWTNIAPGTPGHARIGHQCVMPYPDQMVTIGGFRASLGGPVSCLDGGILQVFNLTAGKWLQSYDPNKWNKYGVPEMVHQKIGGDYGGGATMTTPAPSGWATPDLAKVFDTKYPTSKITPYYPYSSQAPNNGTRGQPDAGKNNNGDSRPWLGPVLGVVLGLAFVTAIVVLIILYRRRKLWWKKKDGGENQTDERTHHIRSWLNNTREKEPTITTDNPSSYLGDMESRNATPMHARVHTEQTPIPEADRHEMPADQRFELMDTSHAVELSGDSISHRHMIAKHVMKPPSPLPDSPLQKYSSTFSSSQAIPTIDESVSSQDQTSSSSAGTSTPSRTVPSNRHAVSSDVSGMSEREVSHLRNLSGATVSSASNTVPSRMSPTPPPLDEFGDREHTGGQNRPSGRSSSLRVSIFRESAGDLDDPPAQHHTR